MITEKELNKSAQKNDDAVYDFLECLRILKNDGAICLLKEFKEKIHR